MALDSRWQILMQSVTELTAEEQTALADKLQELLNDLSFKRSVNQPGPDELYDAAIEEIRQGKTLPLREEDFK